MEHSYTQSEVVAILSNLVNGIGHLTIGDIMPKRFKEQVDLNGEKRWVTGKSLSDLLTNYLTLCIDSGVVAPVLAPGSAPKPPENILYGQYLQDFVAAYKSNQEALTMTGRSQVIKNHILPAWGGVPIQNIKPVDLQKWFNTLATTYSHETLLKIKNTMSPAFDAAVEEGLIPRNPLKSRLLTIGGAETVAHKALPTDKMAQIRAALPTVEDLNIRFMTGLLSYTAMRFEEVLGLCWEDIDFETGWIKIERAVVHPTRNQPEIKDPKTKTSKRRIPLAADLKNILQPRKLTGFILVAKKDPTGKTPMTYTEARNTFRKIRAMFDIQGYSAHDFRDTCATEWREKGIPLDVISSLLGHSKVDVTQTRYVKYRDELFQGVREIFDKPTENIERRETVALPAAEPIAKPTTTNPTVPSQDLISKMGS